MAVMELNNLVDVSSGKFPMLDVELLFEIKKYCGPAGLEKEDKFNKTYGVYGIDVGKFCEGYQVVNKLYDYSFIYKVLTPLNNACVITLRKTSVTPEESKLPDSALTRTIVLYPNHAMIPDEYTNKRKKGDDIATPYNIFVFGLAANSKPCLLRTVKGAHIISNAIRGWYTNGVLSRQLMQFADDLVIPTSSYTDRDVNWVKSEEVSLNHEIVTDKHRTALREDINHIIEKLRVDATGQSTTPLANIITYHASRQVAAYVHEYSLLWGSGAKSVQSELQHGGIASPPPVKVNKTQKINPWTRENPFKLTDVNIQTSVIDIGSNELVDSVFNRIEHTVKKCITPEAHAVIADFIKNCTYASFVVHAAWLTTDVPYADLGDDTSICAIVYGANELAPMCALSDGGHIQLIQINQYDDYATPRVMDVEGGLYIAKTANGDVYCDISEISLDSAVGDIMLVPSNILQLYDGDTIKDSVSDYTSKSDIACIAGAVLNDEPPALKIIVPKRGKLARFIKTSSISVVLSPHIANHILKNIPSYWNISDDKATDDARKLLQPDTIEIIDCDFNYYVFFTFRRSGHIAYFKCTPSLPMPTCDLNDVAEVLYNEIAEYCALKTRLEIEMADEFFTAIEEGKFNSHLQIELNFVKDPMTHPELSLFAMQCLEHSDVSMTLDGLTEVKYLNPHKWLDLSNDKDRFQNNIAKSLIYFSDNGVLSQVVVKAFADSTNVQSHRVKLDPDSNTFQIDGEIMSKPTLSVVYKYAYMKRGGVMKW